MIRHLKTNNMELKIVANNNILEYQINNVVNEYKAVFLHYGFKEN